MKKLISVTIALLLFFCMTGCNSGYTVKSEYVFSDSGILFTVKANGKNFNSAFSEMLNVLDEIDAQININRQGGSDVLNINLAKKGQKVSIGFYTYEMIRLAKEYYTDTAGAFNIAAYPLSYLWGIDALANRDLLDGVSYQNWTVPESFKDSDIVRGLPLPDYNEVLRVKEFCNLDNLQVFTEPGGGYWAQKSDGRLMIDLGGIAKGYAVDLCAEICERFGLESALLNLSGNLFFVGNESGGQGWEVGISDPSGNVFCAYLAEPDTTAVTSGDYERYRIVSSGGQSLRICHIIDTRTGLPYGLTHDGEGYKNADARVVSCSVLSGTSTFADSYAKAVCVGGLDSSIDFLNQRGIQAVAFTADKRLIVTGGIEFIKTGLYDMYKEYSLVHPLQGAEG